MPKQIVSTAKAPDPAGAYSQAIIANGIVYTAGQVPLVPGTKRLVAGGIQEQTRQSLENIQAVLEAAGTSLANVVKVTVFLANISDFAEFNAVYAQYFPQHPPARSTIQAGALPLDARVEIEAVALLES